MVLTRRQQGSTYIVFSENFDLQKLGFKPRCLFRKFGLKDKMAQPILSLKKMLTKTQSSLTHLVFFRKLSLKDNKVQPMLSFQKILTKIQYPSTQVASVENFDKKIICFIVLFYPGYDTKFIFFRKQKILLSQTNLIF